MFSKTGFAVLVMGAVTVGCSLNSDRKDACSVPGDCLDGFACVNHRCEAGSQTDAGDRPDGSGPDNGGSPDAPSQEYGDVAPLTAHSSGIAAGELTLLGTTAVAGSLGCALVGDEAGAPGGEAALVHAKVRAENGDRRCPDGIYAIRNDPDECSPRPGRGLAAQCAMYRRWNTSGTLVAQRLAIGGAVTIRDIELGAMAHRCEVELSFSFAGGTSIQSSFSVDFNPFAPAESFCAH